MSEEEEEGKKKRRRPLTRSRKLGSRRRRGKNKKEEEPEAEAPAAASDSKDAPEGDKAEAPDAPAAPVADSSEHTVPVNKIPSPGGSGSPDLTGVSAPSSGERMAKLKGSARRFTSEFSKFLMGLGQTAHQSGVDFGQNVVKPFSHALFDAAICVVLLFLTGAGGLMFGNYLKTVTSTGNQTVSFQNREVRPGQQMDESFFSQGFDTRELHKRANRVLDDHLRALKGSEFVEAYGLLSPAWKEQLTYPTFESGYLNTRVLAYEIGKVETLDARRIRLRADLKVEEKGKEKLYSAVYIAVLTSKGWRLDGGTFK